jgi:leader peptidase (prepilin peptidase)/N-methyltransferase|tara:strand:+ start:5310 stop:6071 length:762 start_codon:yes stop_codon:yes gene_type:complete
VGFFLAVVLGSVFGSFANVCIYRLPKNKNISKGRSFCPKCKKKINWFDNIPLFSFIFLNGKCRKCNKKISFQYFLVETISAFYFFIIYYFFGLSIDLLLLIILYSFLVIVFFIDLKHFIIPNELTFPLMVIGFLKSFDPNLNQTLFPNYLNSIIGGLFGYFIIWVIIFVYKKLRNKEGMGLGDAKLLSAIGFWFGWYSIPFIIFLSSLSGLLFVLPSLILKKRKLTSKIPFGPFLILGLIVYLLFQPSLSYIL